MAKYTLEVTLKDNKYCNGCHALSNNSEWCRAASKILSCHDIKWESNIKVWLFLRPEWCPLVAVEDVE